MPEALFRFPFYAVWQQTIQKAVAEVNGLERRLFSDPALGGILQGIVDKYSLEVARLQKEGIEGHARQQQAHVNDGWGGTQSVTRGWLDIAIPFTGDAEILSDKPVAKHYSIPGGGNQEPRARAEFAGRQFGRAVDANLYLSG